MIGALDIVLITLGSGFLLLTLCLVSIGGILWYRRKQSIEKARFFNSQPIHPIDEAHQGKIDQRIVHLESGDQSHLPPQEDIQINRPTHIDLPGPLFGGIEVIAEKALSYDTNIRIEDFCDRVREYHENDDTVFHDEFEMLNRQAGFGAFGRVRSVIGDTEENAKRNRFLDVLPYEENRVKLSKKDQDYINASYIDGYEAPHYFIATQGPLGESEVSSGRRVATVDDFWEMVWEYDVSTIIMLTQCVENCRPKCAQYWPGELGQSVKYADMEVSLVSTTDNPICFHRELDVRKGAITKEISQYHFKEWEDSKAPESREHLLDFVERIRKAQNKAPILVHCSAGVGRTGVFIALYNLLCQLEDPKTTHLDVFKTVSKLREQRVRMVQTPEQYVTLYDTLEAAIQAKRNHGAESRRSISIHDSETSESVHSQEPINL